MKKYEESQFRFQTIFYKSKMGNKIIAPDLRVLQINEVMQVKLGNSEKEIAGTKIVRLYHPDSSYNFHKYRS